MRNRKNFLIAALTVIVVGFGMYVLYAGSQDRKITHLVSFVDAAAAEVTSQGEGAFADFNNKDGAWINGEEYIFVYDMYGKTLVLPPQSDLVGTNRITTADPNGEKYVNTMVKTLQFKNYGWNSYQYVKPGTTEPTMKLSYFKKATNGGKSYIVGSGIYVNQ